MILLPLDEFQTKIDGEASTRWLDCGEIRFDKPSARFLAHRSAAERKDRGGLQSLHLRHGDGSGLLQAEGVAGSKAVMQRGRFSLRGWKTEEFHILNWSYLKKDSF